MKYKYQTEYEESQICFWDTSPASYVRLFANAYVNELPKFKALDLGCGEGKNAVYLASLGASVTAIDISPIALDRFKLQPKYDLCKKRVEAKEMDFTIANFNDNSFDLVVAYGILHCLESKSEIQELVIKIKRWVKQGGYVIISTFTDEIPIPPIQEYLTNNALLGKGELQNMFLEWNILFTENSIITESHPTSRSEHQHSLTRLIAKKK